MLFKYQWSQRVDSRHTITLNGCETLQEAERLIEGWVRDLRPGTPWRIVNEHGLMLAGGSAGVKVAPMRER